MKQPKPTNIDCLTRLLTKPNALLVKEINLIDKKNAEADKAAEAHRTNDAIRARRNIKGGENT